MRKEFLLVPMMLLLVCVWINCIQDPLRWEQWVVTHWWLWAITLATVLLWRMRQGIVAACRRAIRAQRVRENEAAWRRRLNDGFMPYRRNR